jgi:hypothetical protein
MSAKETRDLATVIMACGLVMVLFAIGYSYESQISGTTIKNVSALQTVGVSIDQSSIHWGIIGINASVNHQVTVTSTSNIPITLHMTTSNWNPPNCTEYMTLSWNLEGIQLNPGASAPATFTLTVGNVPNGAIVNFSFDITIMGQG